MLSNKKAIHISHNNIIFSLLSLPVLPFLSESVSSILGYERELPMPVKIICDWRANFRKKSRKNCPTYVLHYVIFGRTIIILFQRIPLPPADITPAAGRVQNSLILTKALLRTDLKSTVVDKNCNTVDVVCLLRSHNLDLG